MKNKLLLRFLALLLLTTSGLMGCKGLLGQNGIPAHGQANNPAGALSHSDIVAGLKQALSKGTTVAITTLGQDGGFWNNAPVTIPVPEKLEKLADTARELGLGSKVDAFQHSLNRAAEKAVPEVADIFGNAIRSMTLSDAKGILFGGDHAATDYFRRVASDELAKRIAPIVSRATNSVGVTRHYKQLVSGPIGTLLKATIRKQDAPGALDLDRYVTQKALTGLFYEIGLQEKAIRDNPVARTTHLLKKVFGRQ